MRSLILMEQGLTLGVEGDTLVISRAKQRIERIRPDRLSEVLLFGNIQVSSHAIAMLLAHQVDTIFLTLRGLYRGRLSGPASPHVELRRQQYQKLADPALALRLARAMVSGKIANQRNLLLRAQREQPREGLAEAAAALRRQAESAAAAGDLASLRGHEGAAAAAYFSKFGTLIRTPGFRFDGRNRRPPRDPVNALLSFAYTLMAGFFESQILRAGLDPHLGAFHSADYGRPSLALDLMEEFRPLVADSLALRLINRREIALDDFENPPEEVESAWARKDEVEESNESAGSANPVWLNEAGRKVFFRGWGRRWRDTLYFPLFQEVRTLEEIARQQVYLLARDLKGEAEYQPFVPR